jgi:hypothetical protein
MRSTSILNRMTRLRRHLRHHRATRIELLGLLDVHLAPPVRAYFTGDRFTGRRRQKVLAGGTFGALLWFVLV